MADATTQQPKQRQLSPREEAMEAIANTNRERINAEIKEAGGTEFVELAPAAHRTAADPDADPDDVAAEAERQRLQDIADGKIVDTTKPPADDQLALQQQQDEQAARDEEQARIQAAAATTRAQEAAGIDPAAKLKLKINGRVVEISGEEAIRRLQIDGAAEARLQEANRLLSEAQEQQRALQAAQTQPKKDEPPTIEVDADVTKEFTSALFAGDEGKATQAFQKAVSSAVAKATVDAKGRGDSTPVDPAMIAAQVRQQIAVDDALDRSRRDYPELYADPDIEAVAASKVRHMVREGTPFGDAVDKVGSDMAQKFGWKKRAAAGTPQPAATSNRREDKLARKESLEQSPAGPNVTKTPAQEPTSDVHSVIAEMAKQRGQTLSA